MQFKFSPALILLLIGLLFVSLTACGAESNNSPEVILPVLATTNPDTSPVTSELCDNSLYPTIQGSAWVYTSTGGPGGAFIYTNSITETRQDGFTLTTQFADQTLTQEWTCLPDGLVALQLGGGSAAGVSMQDMTAQLKTSEVSGLSLAKNIASGMQWQYSLRLQGTIVMPGDPQAPADGVYSVTMQEMGRENVNVPAGSFDAVKIQSNATVDIVSSFGGSELPIKFSGTTLTWYAPGIGYVKMVENGDFGGQMYSVTTELQSYNIP
jgi:hypothetical protein